MRCCAPFCRNAPDNVPALQAGRQISFHGFPSDMRLRAAWLRALGKQDVPLPDPAVVCSQHFLDDDIYETESGSRRINAGAIPSTVQVCMMCLETDSKLILLNKYKLEKAYGYLMGYAPCNQGNLKQTICVQCAQKLMNFSRFRDQSLRARALMMDLVEKHELITRRHIKMINRTKFRLKSPMVVTTLGADFCDLHIQEDTSDDKQTESETTIDTGVVKTEESDDSIAIGEDMDVIYEEDENVKCPICSEEFVQDLLYMEHMRMHAQSGSAAGESGTTGVCERRAACGDDRPNTAGEHHRPDTAGRLHRPDTAGRLHRPDTVGRLPRPNTTGALHKPNTADEHHRPDTAGRLHRPDTAGRLHRPDTVGRLPRPNTTGALHKPNTADEHHRPDTAGRLHRPDTAGRLHRPDTVGRLPRPNTTGALHKPNTAGLHDDRARADVAHTSVAPLSASVAISNDREEHLTEEADAGPSSEQAITTVSGDYQSSSNSRIHDNIDKYTNCIVKLYDIFGKKFVSKREASLMITRKLVFSCDSNFDFENKSSETKSQKKPFSCKLCEYKSARKSHLAVHMRKHTGEKPFSCKLCEYKSAYYKGDLVIHMRKHTGEKPFSCKLCEYQSANKSNLAVHMRRKHTGEKPFFCKLCEFKSAHKRNLVVHMRKHIGENCN